MEAVITIDILRRAQFIVTVAAVGLDRDASAGQQPLIITCSRDVRIVADTRVEDVDYNETNPFDVVVVPGGADGARRMAESEPVKKLLNAVWSGGFMVAAICAGPIVLKAANVGLGCQLTSHPSVRADLENVYRYSESRVVVVQPEAQTAAKHKVGPIVTSRGPGTAYEFALTIVRHIDAPEAAEQVMKPMVMWDGISLA